ncbi:MAG: type II CAAX prenyl endopeptidase Rce1 family protein [Spirochaetota bacterium]
MTRKHTLYLAMELLGIFVFIPLLYFRDLIPLPKILTLFIVTAIVILFLYRKGMLFNDEEGLEDKANTKWYRVIAIRSISVAGILILITLLDNSNNLFNFPIQNPVKWILIMLLYPVFSAFPQEIVYRKFFFLRYKSLFRSSIQMYAASSIAFAFLHIVYNNLLAIIITLIGGFIFSITYGKSRSLRVVTIEHAVYGCLVFTIGLGNYFYGNF